ncbi:MAG: BACON domain-containing protein, partial [Chitinophagaceae bacterium]
IRLVFDKAGFNIGRLSFTYKGSASPFLNVSSNSLQMDPYANSKKSINLTSNINWTASSDQTWLTVSPSAGFADATINFTAQENTTTIARVANVTFTGNGVTNKVVTITQDAGGVPYLIVSPTTLLFQNAANTAQNIAINSNTSWTASSSETWLTLNTSSGNGIATITANVTNNTANGSRTAKITISAVGILDRVINVSQNGAPIVISLPIDFEADGTYVFTNFDGGTGLAVPNPAPGGENTSSKVGRIIRNGGATWAGSLLTVSQNINFTTLTTLAMRVYVPRAGVPVLLKLEGSTAPSEILATTTKANTWETLYWNFAGKPSNVYNKLVLMFDFGRTGDGSDNSTFYFDDIRQIVSALPVTLLSFTASQQNNHVQLSWKTANETNNKGFIVEKSNNGNNWQELLFVPAKAINGLGADYSAIDNSPNVGTNYYRLKQVDLDGTVSYSATQLVAFKNKDAKLLVYPIPAKGFVTIMAPEQIGKINYTITNSNGKTVLLGSFAHGNQPNNIALNQLAKGMYFIQVYTDNQLMQSSLLMVD